MKKSINNLAINLFKYLEGDTKFIILCLGSNKCVGDSLGCVVGSLLKYKYKIDNYCYGDLNSNITTNNLDNILLLIRRRHANKKILVIDSAVGEDYDLGNIKLHYGGIVPRSALDNSFSVVGDISIIGVVSSKSFSISNLFNVDKNHIVEMAEIISQAIINYKKFSLNLFNSNEKK